MENWVNYAPFFGVAGAIFAFFLFAYVKSFSRGNETMMELEDMIHEGAMAFLKREYTILVIFIAAVFALLWYGINWQTEIQRGRRGLCAEPLVRGPEGPGGRDGGLRC